MFVKNIFWNSLELRVRSGWRILSFLFLVSIFSLLFQMFENEFAEFLPSNPSNSNMSIFQPVEFLLLVFLSMYICSLYLDKRPFKNYGMNFTTKWTADLGAGILIGIILMSIIFALEYSLGWITIKDQFQSNSDNFAFLYSMMSGVLIFICVGFYEEMIVRGYLLKNISEGFNFKNPKYAVYSAVLLSSLLFGFGHASNPNATLISSLSITFAGVLLALGYLLTGRLAIPIGLHISWNFFQGYIFGFPVSGTRSAASVFVIEQGGPVYLTGGKFGPEAGLIGIFAMMLGLFLIIVWVKYFEKRIEICEDIAAYKRLENKVNG